MPVLKYLKNVVTLSLDEQKCIGCGLCLEVCPHGIFEMKDRHARIVDRDGCMECGACAKNCPVSAVTVQPGVGCAAAIFNQMLGRTEDCCCGPVDGGCEGRTKRTGCC